MRLDRFPSPALAWVALLAALLLATSRAGAIELFDDRGQWLAALGGTPGFSEDFEGFTEDTAFGGAPLATDFFTLSATNPLDPRILFIDAAPHVAVASSVFTTNKLVGFVDQDGVFFEMQFSPGLLAFGTDFSAARSGEALSVAFAAGPVELASVAVATDDGFVGFVLEAGDPLVTRVLLRSADRRPDDELGRGESFTLDNVAGTLAEAATAPEPGSLALLAAALLGVAAARAGRGRGTASV